MSAPLTLDALREAAENGSIDTVLVCQVDMQGRLMGKRFHAPFFLEHALEETHGCNYLLATDQEMETVEGYAATSWESGYGDYTMVPDLATLRRVPWLEGTALVLCDVQDHTTHEDVPHSPRAILKRQLARLAERGLSTRMATELEFFLFDTTYEKAQRRGYHGLERDLASAYNEDYHIFQTTKEEGVMRRIRNGLAGAGITVECSKGEASAGQEEINVLYCRRAVGRRRSRHRQERLQGDRLEPGQGGHVHGEVARGLRRELLAHPPVPARQGRKQRVLRSRRRARHVDADAALRRGAPRARARGDLLSRPPPPPRRSTPTSASSPVPSPPRAPSGRSTTAPPATASAGRTGKGCASSAASAART